MLDAAALREAYENIASVKRIAPTGSFTLAANGLATGVARPNIFGGVFAFKADRTLDAISTQALELDRGMTNRNHRPESIAVLDLGIVGPRGPVRFDFNRFQFPAKPDALASVRRTGRHTLLRWYTQLLRDLNAITLEPLDLERYVSGPARIGGHVVGGAFRFVMHPVDKSQPAQVKKISAALVNKVLAAAVKPTTFRQHMANVVLGSVPHPGGFTPQQLEAPVYEYNPHNRGPIDLWNREAGGFSPFYINIDGKQYAIDVGGLEPDDTEDDPDFEVEELLQG
jgi:hypothetical protein